MIKYLLISTMTVTCLFQTTITCTMDLYGKSFLPPRSQGTNAARDLVGQNRFEHRYQETVHGSFSTTVEYSRSYRSRRIAEYFFSTNKLTITGSAVNNRSSDHLLADYFGLSPNFESVACLEPIRDNVVIDWHAFLQYKNWYFTAHAPLVWTHNQIRINESLLNCDQPHTPFAIGYMGPQEVIPPYRGFKHAIAGDQSFGDVRPLEYGKIACSPQRKLGIADIHLALGYDLVNRPRGYAGLNIRGVIPTGTRPTSRTLFEPIVGNGHHGELGVGFAGRGLIWEMDGEHTGHVHFTFNATHLFGTQQRRSFDFVPNQFGSRYILVKEFNANGDYIGKTLPAINISSLCCDVSVAAQVDLAVMFAYHYNGFGLDLGYNGWLKTREKICCDKNIFPENRYGFKGIQNAGLIPASRFVAHTTNQTERTATLDGNVRALVDAGLDDNSFMEQQGLLFDKSSPVFIQACDLDILSGEASRMITHKFFWFCYFNRNTDKDAHHYPYAGFGGAIEFEGNLPKEEKPNKNSLAQWSLWVKGGFGF